MIAFLVGPSMAWADEAMMVSAKKIMMSVEVPEPVHITTAIRTLETKATAWVTINRRRRSKRSASAPPKRPNPIMPIPRIVPIAPTMMISTLSSATN